MKVVVYNKESNGITLIALIITIIVLLILAGVSLSIVMQGGILDKSQLAVNEYKNSANDEDNTIKDMDKYLDKQLNIYKNDGVDMDKAKEDLEKNPENYIHPDQSSTNGDRAVGTDGKAVNMDLWDGWHKEYDGAHLDYITIGSSQYSLYSNSNIGEDGKIKGTVPQYIYSAEDNKVYTVVSMNQTFKNCNSLKVAPIIPNTVTNMSETFWYCKELEVVQNISKSVIDMTRTFYKCSKLKNVPDIPNSVKNMISTFYGCSVLEKAPQIPVGVIDLRWTFENCNALTGDLIINAENVEVYEECLAEAATNPECDLKLSGSCPQLNEILGTATSGNVSLKE